MLLICSECQKAVGVDGEDTEKVHTVVCFNCYWIAKQELPPPKPPQPAKAAA